MTHTDDPSEFLTAEYNTLRDEILRRTDIQHQLLSFALGALGALVAVGAKDSPSALLAYPILALFLAMGWAYHDIQIAQIGMYIKYRIEERLIGSGLGWQHAILSQHPSREIGSLVKTATRGMFWSTEILAIGLYLLTTLRAQTLQLAQPSAENALLLVSVIATGFTVWTMRNRDSLVDEIEKDMKQIPAVARHA